jgi:hypothetical protein
MRASFAERPRSDVTESGLVKDALETMLFACIMMQLRTRTCYELRSWRQK